MSKLLASSSSPALLTAWHWTQFKRKYNFLNIILVHKEKYMLKNVRDWQTILQINTATSNNFLDVTKAVWKEKLTTSAMFSKSTASVTQFSFSPPLLISISLPSCIYVEKPWLVHFLREVPFEYIRGLFFKLHCKRCYSIQLSFKPFSKSFLFPYFYFTLPLFFVSITFSLFRCLS